MRLVYENGVLQRIRRFFSESASVREEDVKEPGKLAEVLRQLSRRLTAVEAAIPPEATEFEVTLGTGGALTTIAHHLNSAVRWYVTQWSQVGGTAYPVKAPQLVQDASSDANSLVLRSYVAGKAIVRVEPASGQLEPGETVTQTESPQLSVLTSDFTTTTTSSPGDSTGLSFTGKAGERWSIFFQGTAGDSNAAGMKYSIIAPTSSTMAVTHYSSSGAITTRSYQVITSINTLSNAIHTVAGGQRDDQIVGSILLGGDGTVSIGAASVAGTATVYQHSFLRAERIPR